MLNLAIHLNERIKDRHRCDSKHLTNNPRYLGNGVRHDVTVFVLFTNRKSYISFRFVPKLVTLNDLEVERCWAVLR